MKRFFRNLLATGVAGGIAAISGNPAFILIAPVLNALAKYLREKSNNALKIL